MEQLTIAGVVDVLVILTGAAGIALFLYGAAPYLTESGSRRQVELGMPTFRMAAVGLLLTVVAFGIVDPTINPRCPSPTGGGSEAATALAMHPHETSTSAGAGDTSPPATDGAPDDEGGTTWN